MLVEASLHLPCVAAYALLLLDGVYIACQTSKLSGNHHTYEAWGARWGRSTWQQLSGAWVMRPSLGD